MKKLSATRYVHALREGGSLPAIVETDDAASWVVKFRGAGQGAPALIAEILVGELAQALDLPVPELALIELDEAFGRGERDPEIQDILRASHGTNVGMAYLSGAFNYGSGADEVDPLLASRIVWLDALTTNIDRTPRNPNLMWWQEQAWLIDHGAALFFHHGWKGDPSEFARRDFAQIGDHVLLGQAQHLQEVDRELAPRLTADVLSEVVEQVPDDLLLDRPAGSRQPFGDAATARSAYRDYFSERLASPRPFLASAVAAHEQKQVTSDPPEEYRR